MTNPSLSTSDVNERLGFTLTAEFITNGLGVEPDEEGRGKPRWSEDNYQAILQGLATHLVRCEDVRTPAPSIPTPIGGRKPGVKNKPKAITASPKKPAMDYDDGEL